MVGKIVKGSVVAVCCLATCFPAQAEVWEEWAESFNGPAMHSFDVGHDIAVDPEGNIYVTGRAAFSEDRGLDCVLLKYSPSGELLWQRDFDGPGRGDDIGYFVAIDEFSNIYIAGACDTNHFIYCYFVIKYSPDGTRQWLAPYFVNPSQETELSGMALGADGNPVICGWIYNSGPAQFGFITIKYDSQGQLQWDSQYFGISSYGAFATDIAIESDGNVYVTGSARGEDDRLRCATVKYDSAGQEQWVAIYTSPETLSYGNRPSCIALDTKGRIYVTGLLTYLSEECRYQTVKYDQEGTLLWARIFNPNADPVTATMGIYEPKAIVSDLSDNIYITGNGLGPDFQIGEQFVTVSYDCDGLERWSAFYKGLPSALNSPSDIGRDSRGDVYVVGASHDSIFYMDDCVTIKYTADGHQEWVVRWDGSYQQSDGAIAVALDNENNVIVTGLTEQDYVSGFDILTIKYGQSQTPIEEPEPAAPGRLNIGLAYPNPFNSSTIIAFENPAGGALKIELFDIGGRKLRSFALTSALAGQFTWDATDDNGDPVSSGVYFARFCVGARAESMKLTYLK